MAPESDARERAVYDHENVEPRRPRRAAADWGVNEDIFDRMPSRFGRVERRPEHQEIVLRRDVDDASVAVIERDGGRFEREEVAAWTRETGRAVTTARRGAPRRSRGSRRGRARRGLDARRAASARPRGGAARRRAGRAGAQRGPWARDGPHRADLPERRDRRA